MAGVALLLVGVVAGLAARDAPGEASGSPLRFGALRRQPGRRSSRSGRFHRVAWVGGAELRRPVHLRRAPRSIIVVDLLGLRRAGLLDALRAAGRSRARRLPDQQLGRRTHPRRPPARDRLAGLRRRSPPGSTWSLATTARPRVLPWVVLGPRCSALGTVGGVPDDAADPARPVPGRSRLGGVAVHLLHAAAQRAGRRRRRPPRHRIAGQRRDRLGGPGGGRAAAVALAPPGDPGDPDPPTPVHPTQQA